MQTRLHNPFTTIHTEGALLPTDLLQRVLAADRGLDGLTPADYHLTGSEKLNEAINRSWNRLQGSWATFRTSRERLEGDAGTTLTRERWLLPLFQELGYGRLQTSRAIELDGKSYPISHKWGDTPIHLVGCGIELDRRTAGAAGASRSSPHSLLQELLNRAPEYLWGLVSNGLRLRVLRDNASLTRQAFLEFDLESMFEGEVYSDFAVLWLICHQSRVESREQRVEYCWLEVWSKAVQEQGTRALDSLRQGVEGAISALGSGFLRHPANQKLRTDLRSGALSTQGYYRQLLRLVYRLIFLFVAEDRDLLFDPQSTPQARGRYLKYYSLGRLRRLAERSRGGRHPDLYTGLRLVTDILGGRKEVEIGKTGLGLPVLGGFLFAGEVLRDLETAELDNESLLSTIRYLIFIDEGRTRRAVDYKNLGSEELGSIYESLLELHPLVNTDAAAFELTSVSGSERKTTGSYYTPSSLIQVLLDSALEPVIQQAIANAGSSIENQQSAILNLKVCDPACGSGHFLVAAAHRLARRLAPIRTGEGEPAPEALRSALRQVISSCIYGVDINPMSVELCKVSLWMEALEPGKPLSFLDAHIQCGDSLVGVGPNLDISEIPDEAFSPAFGDDKATSSALKKRNKAERRGQMGLDVFVVRDEEDLQAWMAQEAESVEALPEETLEQVGQKAHSYQEYLASPQYQRRKQEYDLWTSTFFWKMEAQPGSAGILAPTQEMLRRQRSGGTLPPELIRRVDKLSARLNFFHWELAFPSVFHPSPAGEAGRGGAGGSTQNGRGVGFDCVLGNPPWERIKLQEEEFFAQREPKIATAPTKAARQKMIDALTHSNPALSTAFEDAKHAADASSKFLREGGRFPLTAVGDLNTYPLFTENFRILINTVGRAGIIVPTGIATDDTTKEFFNDLMQNKNLASLYGFVNEKLLFAGVLHNFRYVILTMTGKSIPIEYSDFAYNNQLVEDLKQSERHFTFSSSELRLVNPESGTCPVFTTDVDAKLVKVIHFRIPILSNIITNENPWNIDLSAMFHMSNDSSLFKSIESHKTLPLYESKMFTQFDHRFSSYESSNGQRMHMLPRTTIMNYENPLYKVTPSYFVDKSDIIERVPNYWEYDWLLAFRSVASGALERTFTATVLPLCALGNSAIAIFTNLKNPELLACLLANFNSIVLDYVVKQKAAGANLNFFKVRQLPILSPSIYTPADIEYIAPRVLELVYTAYDVRPFSEDMGYHGEPFRWDEVRRAHLRAELDAYYARLYGLTRDELRYILDPKEVYGEDFPGETFRVLKEKEMRLYGEFRTRRLVLEAWDAMESIPVSGVSVSGASVSSPSVSGVSLHPEKSPEKIVPVDLIEAKQSAALTPARKEPQAVEEAPIQPMLSDFGLYKCPLCGKMVMGYEKEKHAKEQHSRKNIEWRKVR